MIEQETRTGNIYQIFRLEKRLGLVVVTRGANWRIYQIPEPATPLLIENLKCLQGLKAEGCVFRSDLKKLNKTDTAAACLPEQACSPTCK